MKCLACGCKNLEEYYRHGEHGYVVYRCTECNHLEYYADLDGYKYKQMIMDKKEKEFFVILKEKLLEKKSKEEKKYDKLLQNVEKNKNELKSSSETIQKCSHMLYLIDTEGTIFNYPFVRDVKEYGKVRFKDSAKHMFNINLHGKTEENIKFIEDLGIDFYYYFEQFKTDDAIW